MDKLKKVILVWLLVFFAVAMAQICGDALGLPRKH